MYSYCKKYVSCNDCLGRLPDIGKEVKGKYKCRSDIYIVVTTEEWLLMYRYLSMLVFELHCPFGKSMFEEKKQQLCAEIAYLAETAYLNVSGIFNVGFRDKNPVLFFEPD